MAKRDVPKVSVTTTAIWLRRIGGERNGRVQVLLEIDDVWRVVIDDAADANYSHIAEGRGAEKWPVDSRGKAND